MNTAGENVEPYPSLDAIRHAHDELLQSLPDDDLELSDEARHAQDAHITEFIRRSVVTGGLLDTPADRKAAQGLIDFWVARAYATARGRNSAPTMPARADLLLKPFETNAVKQAFQRADDVIRGLDMKGQELARKILLHLVRLSASGACVASPSTRDNLLAFGNVNQAEAIINDLVQAGVLRATPEEDGQDIELRFQALTRLWPRLRGWIDERIRFRGWAEAWEQSGRRSGTLLFNRALLKQADAYGDLNKLELEFKQRSSRSFKWTVGAALAATAGTLAALSFFGGLIYKDINLYPFREKQREVKSDSATPAQKKDAIKWLMTNQSKLPPDESSFDFSNAKLQDLDLSQISLSAPNFSRAVVARVSFDGATLSNARFSESKIADSSFARSALSFARFDGATLSSIKFDGAKLYRSIFDSARLCKVDFSGADIRAASFQGVVFDENDTPIFRDTAWWLARGWSLSQAEKLSSTYSDVKPEESNPFKEEKKEYELNIRRFPNNTLNRASALNGKAWTLATYGVFPAVAEQAAQDAIAIAEISQPPSVRAVANFKDTLAYVLLQIGQTDAALKLLKEAVEASQKPDPDILFRYGVALNAAGREAEAIEMLKKSVEVGNYSPSHELHLLRAQITGVFRTKLNEMLGKRRSPDVPTPPPCPAGTGA